MLTKRPKVRVRGAVDKRHEWQQKQGIKNLLWLLLGVALCLAFGVFLSLSPSLHKKSATVHNKAKAVPPLSMEYEFYERLPKQRFVGADDNTVQAPVSTFVIDDYKIWPTNLPEHYVLQIQSYENAHAAEQKRAQVIMAGVDASVIKVTQDKITQGDGVLLYRVVSEPLFGESVARSAYERLKASGIDSVVIYRTHARP